MSALMFAPPQNMILRRPGEGLVIDGACTVRVLRVRPDGAVELGIVYGHTAALVEREETMKAHGMAAGSDF